MRVRRPVLAVATAAAVLVAGCGSPTPEQMTSRTVTGAAEGQHGADVSEWSPVPDGQLRLETPYEPSDLDARVSPDGMQIVFTTTHAPCSVLTTTAEEDPGHVRVAIELDDGCGEEFVASAVVARVPVPLAAPLADRLLVITWTA